MNRRPICFDATGTLIELSESVGEVYRRIALAHGVDLPAWRLDDAFRRILERAPIRGVDGDTLAEREGAEVKWWSERIRETFQATDSTIRFDDFPSFAAALFDVYRRAEAWRLRAGAVEMLTRLREQRRPMAIVSNFDHRLPDLLEVLGISSFFSALSIPSRSQFIKPDRPAFEFVAKALKAPIESLCYVGDDAQTVLEAVAGLGLCVFDIREIEHLEDIPDLIARAATLPPRPGNPP